MFLILVQVHSQLRAPLRKARTSSGVLFYDCAVVMHRSIRVALDNAPWHRQEQFFLLFLMRLNRKKLEFRMLAHSFFGNAGLEWHECCSAVGYAV